MGICQRGNIVERSKNNRSRKVPMNSTVAAELGRLRGNGTPFVFTQRAGERPKSIAAFATACRRAGMGHVRFHDLRHTFATNLVMGGIDLVTVKEILGHNDISMTVRYSHPSNERKMAAVELISGLGRKGCRPLFPGEMVTIWSQFRIWPIKAIRKSLISMVRACSSVG